MFLNVPTATRDDYTECLADLRTCGHEATPDRVFRSCEGQSVNSRASIRSRRTELGGALITMIVPAGAVSTKCEESFAALVSEENTICTVYAGPQIILLDPEDETRWMSGM